MGMFDVFDIAGSAMRAQSMRLNVTSSNLANAENIAGSADAVYRARQAVFSSHMLNRAAENTGVRVLGIVESAAEPMQRFQPDHPLADDRGFVYATNVNPIEEMVNMLSASRSFQSNVEVLNTTKELLLGTLRLGQ